MGTLQKQGEEQGINNLKKRSSSRRIKRRKKKLKINRRGFWRRLRHLLQSLIPSRIERRRIKE
jgi:hypothetical protein